MALPRAVPHHKQFRCCGWRGGDAEEAWFTLRITEIEPHTFRYSDAITLLADSFQIARAQRSNRRPCLLKERRSFRVLRGLG